MAYIDNFENLFQKTDDMTAEKIILKFFDTDFLNLKTEIPSRMLIDLATLEALSPLLKKKGLKKTSALVDELVRLIKEFMISLDRKSRGEGERMIGSIRQQLANKGILGKILGAE